jgi:23S rRNA (uracil1939-C5)-methyltransferase
MVILRPGAELVLTIDDLSSEGAGVGRSDGVVVFAPGAVPGDTVRLRLTRLQKRFAEAELLAILEPAAARREPGCAHQPQCGGCPLMVLSEPAALSLKTQHLEQTMRRIGGLTPPTVETIASPRALRYRGRVRFAVGAEHQRGLFGFRERGRGDRLVPIEDCHLAPEPASILARAIVTAIESDASRRAEPWLKELELRHAFATDAWLAILHTEDGVWPELSGHLGQVMRAYPSLVGAVRSDRHITLLAGRDRLTEQVGAFRVVMGPSSFLQVNPAAAALLYQRAQQWVASGDDPPRRVLDLFCGFGLAGLTIAPAAARLYGIDLDAGAIEQASEVARARPDLSAKFRVWDARVAVAELGREQIGFDLLVINPPRAGLGSDAAPAIRAMRPRQIVMISCHPAALARDVGALHQHGFDLEHLIAVDMFPQTAELEVLALLVARK